MKLKDLLSESSLKVLDRKFGEPLPTLADTTRAYKLKQEELNEKAATAGDKDVKTVAAMIGKSPLDVRDFVNQYDDLDADDLIDVLDSGADRRRNALMVMAAMKGNRRALRQLDNLLGFL